MVDLQKVGISAVGGALYAAGAVVGAGACAILYFTGSKINAFIDSYMPSIKGTLNASLMTGTSCLVALPLAKVIGRKTESPFAAAAAGALTVFLTTTLATPTVSKMLLYFIGFYFFFLFPLFKAKGSWKMLLSFL